MTRKKKYNFIIECFMYFIENIFQLFIFIRDCLSCFLTFIVKGFSCFLTPDQEKLSTSLKNFINSLVSEMVHINITDIEYQKRFSSLFKNDTDMEIFSNLLNKPKQADDLPKKNIVIFLVHGLRGCNSHFAPVLEEILEKFQGINLSSVKIVPINTEDETGIFSVEKSNEMLNNAIKNNLNCASDGMIFMGHSMGGHRLLMFFIDYFIKNNNERDIEKFNSIKKLMYCIANPESQKIPEICNFIARARNSPLSFLRDYYYAFLEKERLKHILKYVNSFDDNMTPDHKLKGYENFELICIVAKYDWIVVRYFHENKISLPESYFNYLLAFYFNNVPASDLNAVSASDLNNKIVVLSSHMSVLVDDCFLKKVADDVFNNILSKGPIF